MTRDELTRKIFAAKRAKGLTWKAIVAEVGGGIMSAIDFDTAIERQVDPKGDRVKLTLSGKFLPYKEY